MSNKIILPDTTETVTSEPSEMPESSETIETTETQALDHENDGLGFKLSLPLAAGAGVAIALVSVALTVLIQKLVQRKRNKKKEAGRQEELQRGTAEKAAAVAYPAQMAKDATAETAGKVHNIGRRNGQQDSFGVVNIPGGVCAVVADGMGGLADGDKVSQKIVRTMMQDARVIKDGAAQGTKLYSMAAHANREVNRMLGSSGQYKSGSTLIAVLTEGRFFQWISIGDSRIYLFRGNKLIQLNGEHVYERELLLKAANNRISFSEANSDKQRDRLTSFIGMGDLTHIDGSLHPVETQAGDRILLMSDGVFNTLSDQEIGRTLSETRNAMQAANVLEQRILARGNPKQDNFTAVILEF